MLGYRVGERIVANYFCDDGPDRDSAPRRDQVEEPPWLDVRVRSPVQARLHSLASVQYVCGDAPTTSEGQERVVPEVVLTGPAGCEIEKGVLCSKECFLPALIRASRGVSAHYRRPRIPCSSSVCSLQRIRDGLD